METNIFSELKIGNVAVANRLILAPLAGYTDVAFRRLCKEYGAGLTVTEMVSAKGLCYNGASAADLLRTHVSEKPCCIQLFGAEPKFVERAIALEQLEKFDIIDLNMGCPVKKITSNAEGSALMKEPKKAAAVIAAAVRAASKTARPVTVKIRAGWNEHSRNAVQIAQIAEGEGAAAVAVHGRVASQLYGGCADWDLIGQVAERLSIPVIGNGDVKSAEQAAQKIKDYKVAGVMIGRGALGNPNVFGNIAAQQSIDMLIKHIAYMREYFDERYTVTNMRKHIPHYLKGIKGIKQFKNELYAIESADVLVSCILQIADSLKEN